MNRTENFIWHQENLVASGTRATIYQGFHRFSGEFVAVKVNKTQGDASHRGYLTTIDDAEIRLVKDLRHENLVQFLVFERLEESTDQAELIGEQVLFFEYCHGPSVDRLLQSPMFRYGLPCETFIELLKDLNEALRFLKTKNILYTDIRPENIFQSIDSNGKPIFKLSDLKNARRIQQPPRNKSKSLVSSSNSSEAELWPLAETIFQCITGHWPIEQFGTNSMDRVRLRRLWATKPSGHLCGVEVSADGNIRWSKTFPKSTPLPKSLQLIFEDLLINAMDNEPNWLMTFDDFLDEIESVLHLIPIHYTVVERFLSTSDYFSGDSSIEEFFAHVHRQSNVPNPLEYRIFFNNHAYFPTASMTMKDFSAQLPCATSREVPLILYPISSLDFHRLSLTPIYLPALRRQIGENNDLSALVDWSNELLGLIYFLKSFITNFDLSLRTIDAALQTMHRYLKFRSLTLLSVIRQKCLDYEILREIEEISRCDELVRPRRRTKSLVRTEEDNRPILSRANDFFRQLNSFEQQLTTLINENLNCQTFNDETLRDKTEEKFSTQNQRLERQIKDATMFNETFRISSTKPSELQLSFYQIQRKYLANFSQRFFTFVRHDCQEFVRDNVQRYSQRILRQTTTFEEIQYFQRAYDELLSEAMPIEQIRQAVEQFLQSKSAKKRSDDEAESSFLVTYVDENPRVDSIRSRYRTAIEQTEENAFLLEQIVDWLKTHLIELPRL